MTSTLKKRLRKYLVMGSQNCKSNPVNTLESAIAGGITAFQYREKGENALTGDAKLHLGKQLRETCHRHNVLFIVNDDIDLVRPLDADGIHVGQDDKSVQEIRKSFPDKIIGLSVSNTREVTNSPINMVDYLGAGPIFSTNTKADAKTPVGVEWVKTLRKEFPNLPIVGIGGINTQNATSVIQSGADGVAIISAITQALNITEVVNDLKF
ncbi:thiamine phosphate synthase [Virgibacillus byunsanensis]|uniref:Thiamine-phosphate synthase n=1 Tax=Virgibacillus byunsanensis TaxID=570945 RepID=A0ABW3LPU1_9BACI